MSSSFVQSSSLPSSVSSSNPSLSFCSLPEHLQRGSAQDHRVREVAQSCFSSGSCDFQGKVVSSLTRIREMCESSLLDPENIMQTLESIQGEVQSLKERCRQIQAQDTKKDDKKALGAERVEDGTSSLLEVPKPKERRRRAASLGGAYGQLFGEALKNVGAVKGGKTTIFQAEKSLKKSVQMFGKHKLLAGSKGAILPGTLLYQLIPVMDKYGLEDPLQALKKLKEEAHFTSSS